MKLISIVIPLIAAPVWLTCFPAAVRAEVATPDSAPLEFFERRVRPLLAANCYNCHSANTNTQGGLRVDDRAGLMRGGGRGPGVVPGDPGKSLLIEAVRHSHSELKMPPGKRLTEDEIADLAKWIADGVVWPQPKLPDELGEPNEDYARLRREHWAWQPVGTPAVPAVTNTSWPRDDIDRFLLARLEARGLRPTSDARRQALIRRASFDLTGLPPRPEEIDAFLEDESADAFAALVDRLIGSPAFGERWGRHWLDVARYAESTGSSRNIPYPHAWRYRDYVIDAFANDKPFDRFIREQVAGDLLPANSPREKAEQLVATGFLAIGVKDVNQRFRERFLMDNVDEQIDAISRSILALTVSCARCHNHKFDPISTVEYYGLAGILRSTELCAGVRSKMGGSGLDYYDPQSLLALGMGEALAAEAPDRFEEAKTALAEAVAELQSLRNNPAGDVKGPDGRPRRAVVRQKVNQLRGELLALTDPAANGPVALGAREAATVGDTEVRLRGEAEKLGPVVPRGVPGLLPVSDVPSVNPRQSGRLELAQWLTSPQNPLTPRVIVNRVWQHLFGQGLVRTVDNFGTTGDSPSHPELLDHLARRFVAGGWSVKRLVRAIVLTRAYQLSAESIPENLAGDPDNRLVWRHAPRRLEAEEIRDAILVAAGRLVRERFRGTLAGDLKVVELRNNGPEARRIAESARASIHRGIYLPVLRGLTPPGLEAFDFADQGTVTGGRDTTTVAPQALYLLNDAFVRQQSLAQAERLLQRTDLDDSSRIHWAYRLTLGRAAAPREVDRAERFLAEYERAARQQSPATGPGAEPADISKTPSSAAGPAGNPIPTAQAAEKKPAPAAVQVNPDDPVPAEPEEEEQPFARDARTSAWAGFCQALFGAAEFRYLK